MLDDCDNPGKNLKLILICQKKIFFFKVQVLGGGGGGCTGPCYNDKCIITKEKQNKKCLVR